MRFSTGAAAALVVCVALGAAAPARANGPPLVIPPGREAEARALVAGVGFRRDLGDGTRIDAITLARTEVVYELRRDGRVVGHVRLEPRSEAGPGEPVTRSFVVRRDAAERSPQLDAELDAIARSIAAHDDGDFYVQAASAPRGPRGDRRLLGLRGGFLAAGVPPLLAGGACVGAGLLLALLAWSLHRRRPESVVFDAKPTHLIPTVVQALIFVTWGLYWRGLPAFLPSIALQLAFAYVADALVSLGTRRVIVLGLAPLPIVGSINLFVQFDGREVAMPLAAILLAVLSKAFLRRAGDGGGHVFNPSAFGVTVVAFFHLAVPSIASGDNALRFNLPPNMTEVIFLLAFLPQSRRPIVLVSAAAVISMALLRETTGVRYFEPLWAPVFLSITLLATDPATIPKTGAGRVLFGALLGAGFLAAAAALDLSGRSDFYGKVIAVPFVNLCTPLCDRLGARLHAKVREALEPAHNQAHVLAWAVLVVVSLLVNGKEGAFVPSEHASNGTPLIARDRHGAITCAANPAFCVPFAFPQEVAGWARRLSGAGANGGVSSGPRWPTPTPAPAPATPPPSSLPGSTTSTRRTTRASRAPSRRRAPTACPPSR